MNKSTIKQDIAILQEQVKEIKDNHLPHLELKIDKIQDKIDKEQWFIISTSVGIVITLASVLWK